MTTELPLWLLMGETMVKLRAPHNYDYNQASDEAALRCTDPSLTKQADAEDADINTIVRRFNVTGQLPQNVRMPTYGDFTDIPDFHQAQNAIRMATESFAAMPAHVRARFHNDPHEFVEFCSDDSNRAEAEKLGLVTPKPAPQISLEDSRSTLDTEKEVKKGDTKDKAKGVT